jgi:hypothetical protein
MTYSLSKVKFTVDSIHGIDANQQACLTEIFRIATDSINLTLAPEAFFNVDKFDMAKAGNYEDFELFISQVHSGGKTLWRGRFESGLDKWLIVIEQ